MLVHWIELKCDTAGCTKETTTQVGLQLWEGFMVKPILPSGWVLIHMGASEIKVACPSCYRLPKVNVAADR